MKLLAASPNAGVHDGQEALRWAREITRGIGSDQWSLIDSLAAAYAETGQFDAATAEMQKVLKHTTASRDSQAAQMARRRLALYQAGKPLREQAEPAAFAPAGPAEAPPR